MATGLDMFKKEMEPARQLYTREIIRFTKKYDAIGEMSVREFPDIDTQEYIFSFKRLNGTSQNELDEILLQIANHMEEFSKTQGIEKFYQFRLYLAVTGYFLDFNI